MTGRKTGHGRMTSVSVWQYSLKNTSCPPSTSSYNSRTRHQLPSWKRDGECSLCFAWPSDLPDLGLQSKEGEEACRSWLAFSPTCLEAYASFCFSGLPFPALPPSCHCNSFITTCCGGHRWTLSYHTYTFSPSQWVSSVDTRELLINSFLRRLLLWLWNKILLR